MGHVRVQADDFVHAEHVDPTVRQQSHLQHAFRTVGVQLPGLKLLIGEIDAFLKLSDFVSILI